MKKVFTCFVISMLFLSLISVLVVRAEPFQIKVAWLQYGNDWNTDVETSGVLQTNGLKPNDWEILWDIIDLETASKEDFLAYNLIVATGHSSYTMTTTDNEKLEYYVRMGGTLWIDNCGGLQLNDFFMLLEFTTGEVGYGGQDIIYPGHPLIAGVYILSGDDVNNLGEGSGYSNLIQSYDSDYEGIIEEHSDELMCTLSAEYGLGEIVVTAQDIFCAIQGLEVPDLKFAYNVMAKSKIRVDIDIKPGSYPNAFNMKDKGVLPVAILGSDYFDVYTVDPATVLLKGVSPIRWAYEDVNLDGYMDMTLKFDMRAITAALGIVNIRDVITLTLEGKLFYGIGFQGTDDILVVNM